MLRRDFLKRSFVALVTFIAGQTVWAQGRKKKEGAAAAPGELPLVTPGQGMAASVNYVHKNSDIKDEKLKVERQGVKFADQKCANCILYSTHGVLNGEEVGKCQLFANQLVKSTGWCTSWAKKG